MTNVKVARDSQSVMSKSEVLAQSEPLLRFADVDDKRACSAHCQSHHTHKVTCRAWPENICLENISHYKKRKIHLQQV